MPINIPEDLPATKTLLDENIFVMTEKRALSQDIRPLKIVVLNLMPTKIETETSWPGFLATRRSKSILNSSIQKAMNRSTFQAVI